MSVSPKAIATPKVPAAAVSEASSTSDSEDDITQHRKLITHYENRLKEGNVLKRSQLLKFVADNGLARPSDKFLKSLPQRYESTATRSRYVRPKSYQSAIIERYGTLFMDLAQFYKDKR